MPEFKPFEMGFSFAIGFQAFETFGQLPDQITNLRDDIVKFKFEYVNTDTQGKKVVTPVDLVPCSDIPLEGDKGYKINQKSFLCPKPN